MTSCPISTRLVRAATAETMVHASCTGMRGGAPGMLEKKWSNAQTESRPMASAPSANAIAGGGDPTDAASSIGKTRPIRIARSLR
jgi:hypothetical protein